MGSVPTMLVANECLNVVAPRPLELASARRLGVPVLKPLHDHDQPAPPEHASCYIGPCRPPDVPRCMLDPPPSSPGAPYPFFQPPDPSRCPGAGCRGAGAIWCGVRARRGHVRHLRLHPPPGHLPAPPSPRAPLALMPRASRASSPSWACVGEGRKGPSRPCLRCFHSLAFAPTHLHS